MFPAQRTNFGYQRVTGSWGLVVRLCCLLGDRHTSTRVNQLFIFTSGEIEVCDEVHSLIVMNKLGRFGNSLHAVGMPTLCKERKGCHPPAAEHLALHE